MHCDASARSPYFTPTYSDATSLSAMPTSSTDMNSDRPPSRPSIRVQPDAVHPPPRSLTSFQVLQRPPASLVTIEGARPEKLKKKMYPSPALPFFQPRHWLSGGLDPVEDH
ncbi:hypothetical protein LZ32DRAFT_603085 [Colletotrichum eremochloae]|nr:hypothetical protein LZ32DRAFT_603085 [Colletotrichum eremochloae]